ncbi:LOW QUALITY PROTEIN: hypothetical protein TorRG33x02_137460 [Trema orientale]|uniref:Uncharacterized protein n=1 Tax=Trema orientale TaxID=63057 RepID=A0A2P5EY50_TREOI|nr:LOW QUALITY PROTEIN: hypothetical protein TorRG33x02_137460 [Trema orientale]
MKLLLSFCTSLSAAFFTANGDCLRYVGKGVLPLTHALFSRFVFNIFGTLSDYVGDKKRYVSLVQELTGFPHVMLRLRQAQLVYSQSKQILPFAAELKNRNTLIKGQCTKNVIGQWK